MKTKIYLKIKIIGVVVRIAGLLLLIISMGFTFTVKNESGNDKIVDLEVKTDSSSYILSQVLDSAGQTKYFYRDIDQFPCEDSVCERMHVRLYWDTQGKYMKLTTDEGTGLTKLNHKPFSSRDYQKLNELLGNPKSYLRYYKLENLTNKAAEKHYYSVDAVSGATVTEISYETVRGAVKTCFVLWKIATGETSAYIKRMNMVKSSRVH
jgi:hypothetical protein